MKFSDLPTGFPSISKAVVGLLSEPIGPQPDIRSIGQKTFEAFLNNSSDLNNIKPRDWRNVPYAIWLKDSGGLFNRPDVIERYLNEELPKGLDEGRRPIKWGRPLIFIYIADFNPQDKLFVTIAKHTKNFYESTKINKSSKVVELAVSLNLFDVNEGPIKTAESIALSQTTFSEWINKHDLWLSFGTSPFAEAAFKAFLETNTELRRSNNFIRTVFEWGLLENGNLRYSKLRSKLADSLLLPWQSQKPTDDVQSKLMAFFIKTYGNPSDPNTNLWHGVNSEAIGVIKGWITGRTLEAFFRILQETADTIWQYREKFWMAYFKGGYIDDVCVALGSDGTSVLRRVDGSKQLRSSNLIGANSSQSVLLIRIGQLVFCEWSHNGKLRAQRIDAPSSPLMHKSYYDAEDLRFMSLDFNNGLNQDGGLVHFSAESGGWQERARLFIQKQTGVRLTQAEVTK